MQGAEFRQFTFRFRHGVAKFGQRRARRAPRKKPLTDALTGPYPLAIAGISLIYSIGLPFVVLAPETAGEALPE